MKTIAFTRFFFLIVLLFLQVSCGEGDDNNGGTELVPAPEEKYNAVSITEGISDWSEAIFTESGNVICYKENASTHLPEHMLVAANMNDMSVENYLLSFYGNGMLKTVETSGFLVRLTNYQKESCDVTIYFSNGVSLFYEGLKFESISTKAWNDNNWVRNTCNVLNVIASGIGIGMGVAAGGTVIIASSGVTITIAGLVAIVSSAISLHNSLKDIVGSSSNAIVGHGTTIEALIQSYDKFGGGKYSQTLAIVVGGITVIDDLWGNTLTYEDRQKEIVSLLESGFNHINSIEIGTTTAKCTALVDQYSVHQKIGVCYSFENQEPFIASDQAVIGKVESIGDKKVLLTELIGLEQGTEYYYRPFITSADRTQIGYGEVKKFTTKKCITGGYHSISDTEYVCIGEVGWDKKENEDAEVQFGICYSETNSSPDWLSDNVVYGNDEQQGIFEVTLGDLKKGKTYYYRCFLSINENSYYGEPRMIKTDGEDDLLIGRWKLIKNEGECIYDGEPTDGICNWPWGDLIINADHTMYAADGFLDWIEGAWYMFEGDVWAFQYPDEGEILGFNCIIEELTEETLVLYCPPSFFDDGEDPKDQSWMRATFQRMK